MIAYWILLPQFLISVLSWIQLILSMNRFRGVCMFTRTDVWALVVFLHSGFVRWIAALAVRGSTLRVQIFAAFVGTVLSWISFVIVFNEGFLLPSRQQWWALMMSVFVTSLWEVNSRLVIEM